MRCLTQAPRRLHHLRMELHDRMKYYMEVKRSAPQMCHGAMSCPAQSHNEEEENVLCGSAGQNRLLHSASLAGEVLRARLW